MENESIKEVKVVLATDAEAKALMGGKAPRRRGTRKQRGGAAVAATEELPESGRVQDIGGSLSPQAAAVAEGPVARIEKADAPAVPEGIQAPVGGEGRGAPLIGGGAAPVIAVSPLAEKLSITPPATTVPALSTTTVAGGGGGGRQEAPIVIANKRGGGTVSTVPVAKILPTKRRNSGAPAAQTFKKPKFRIGGAETPSAGPSPSGGEPVAGGSKVGGAAKQTRRFKARKIKLTVKSSRATKEVRQKVKAKVRAMPITDVRKLLLSKGIIKAAAADKLPEEMLRHMLRDYMLLHNAE